MPNKQKKALASKSSTGQSSSSKPEKPGFFSPSRYIGKGKANYRKDYDALSNDDLLEKNVSSRLKRDREASAALFSNLHTGTGLLHHAPVHASRLKKLDDKVGASDSKIKDAGLSRPEIDWGDRLVEFNKGMADGAFHLRTVQQIHKASQTPQAKQAWNDYKTEVKEVYSSGDWNPTSLLDYD